jgi:phosphoglycerate-specific signal transduction histidine kinase
VKELGKQRAAMITCMTCASTAERWGTWEDDPRRAVGREIEWEAGYYGRRGNGTKLRDELLAIAALIASHPDEFAAKIDEIGRRREWLAQKSAREQQAAAGRRSEKKF